MNAKTLTALLVAAGLAGAPLSGCKRRERPLPAEAAAPMPAGQMPAGQMPPGQMPPGAMPQQGGMPGPSAMDVQRRIAAAEQVVAQDPKNVQAWIQLGNDYFDTQQRQKAIDAYARALELNPRNADVLTDQGVMYREVGAYDKAIANFQKANEVDPSHLQSLFNLGVVYAYDLKQPDKAVQAWNTIVAKAPTSPHAAQARQAIQELQRQQAAPMGR